MRAGSIQRSVRGDRTAKYNQLLRISEDYKKFRTFGSNDLLTTASAVWRVDVKFVRLYKAAKARGTVHGDQYFCGRSVI